MNRQPNSEDIVQRVLEKLEKEKLIAGFLRNRPSDRLDSEGIDFLIFLNNGKALPLQVKTFNRKYSKEDKMREHLRKHPLVRNLICVPTYLAQSDEERMLREVEKELRKILSD